MSDIFESAADRIVFSEAVDFIEQGRAQLIPAHLADAYVGKGLLVKSDGTLRVTEEGQRQHKLAQRERFSDG
jgi:hypothetical protein